MDFIKFKDKVKLNPYQPIYFLYGEEAYFIDQLSAFIVEQTVEPAMKDFNFMLLYGEDASYANLMDSVSRYPMMAEHQVVVLREAQRMKEFDMMHTYFAQPQSSTVFIIEYKNKIDKRLKHFKHLAKLDTAFESKKVRDYEIANWIMAYIKSQKGDISIQNAQLIAEHLGSDLNKVVNEIQKLTINLGPGAKITGDDIEKYIGISKDYNIFELQKAIGLRDHGRVIKITEHMAHNEKDFPLVMLVSILFNYFSKIYMFHFLKQSPPAEKMKALGLGSAFFLKEFEQASKNYPLDKCEKVLRLLQDFDLRSKGIGNPSGEKGGLVKELIIRMTECN
ncbi:DNA polymerase III subunit delta [Membranihabitans marinus]|uniref:DNA polymerase III subunit delta n=1 Tax=Membranihabitans marinus TaxID=1227546 RepID=UPI001F015C4B|nr:DNA polymerase III subunit delta [Membranihabitans marinus]